MTICLKLKGPLNGQRVHIKAHEFICDVLSSWETKRESSPTLNCKVVNFFVINVKLKLNLLKQPVGVQVVPTEVAVVVHEGLKEFP